MVLIFKIVTEQRFADFSDGTPKERWEKMATVYFEDEQEYNDAWPVLSKRINPAYERTTGFCLGNNWIKDKEHPANVRAGGV